MHELGITRNIIAIVSEHADDKPVKCVTIDIGKWSAIMPESIRFCFDVCSKNTPLEKAILEINEIPGLGHCDEYGVEIELKQLFGQCHSAVVSASLVSLAKT